MFEFINKRGEPVIDPAQIKAAEAAQADLQKKAALAAAHALQGDEQASVAFILACPFSDARSIAAEHVVSQALVEQVWQAMRNADRRVAKLMQQRLDTFKRSALALQQALQCIATAERLLSDARLLTNQVVDLDHAWQIVQQPPAEQAAQFQNLRQLLGARLEAQAALQHEMLELVANLRVLAEAETLDTEQANQTLARAASALEQCRLHAEASSLPSALLNDFERRHTSLKALFERSLAPAPAPLAVAASDAASATVSADANGSATTERPGKPKKPSPAPQDPALLAQFSAALAGLEKSIQDGVLHDAVEFDRRLREPALHALRLTPAQNTQLGAARTAMSSLQGWARWGGNVSRDELLIAAETLAGKTTPLAELSKKVGALREQWKALDGSAGPANKELWTRFDTACTTAYAPAAAHYKKLAEERTQNQAKAQVQLDALQASVSTLTTDEAIDWKKLTQLITSAKDAWQRGGPMERKEKKRLDSEFAKTIEPLEQMLRERRIVEIAQREAMIAEVSALQPNLRGTLDALRGLQERWQASARALPLAHREEQGLWQRFRQACDAVFAARKEVAHSADAERRQHLQARETLCASLEAAVGQSEAGLAKILRDVREAWNKTGQVPRAAEKQIEQRYQAAITALQKGLDLTRRASQDAQRNAVRDKLNLCRQAEAVVLGEAQADTALASTWAALPSLPKAIEAVLSKRFEQALQADASYAATLRKNLPMLASELLRCEILFGIDSPPALARERLQQQVAVLQATLKNGPAATAGESALTRLCSLAASTDEQQFERLTCIVERALQSKK